jgi:hypothetical protein
VGAAAGHDGVAAGGLRAALPLEPSRRTQAGASVRG